MRPWKETREKRLRHDLLDVFLGNNHGNQIAKLSGTRNGPGIYLHCSLLQSTEKKMHNYGFEKTETFWNSSMFHVAVDKPV